MSSQNYNLNIAAEGQAKSGTWPALVKLVNLLPEQRSKLILALIIHGRLCRPQHAAPRPHWLYDQ